MTDPMKLITEKEPDLGLVYDFDSMPTEKRKFLLMVFFLESA